MIIEIYHLPRRRTLVFTIDSYRVVRKRPFIPVQVIGDSVGAGAQVGQYLLFTVMDGDRKFIRMPMTTTGRTVLQYYRLLTAPQYPIARLTKQVAFRFLQFLVGMDSSIGQKRFRRKSVFQPIAIL